MLTEYGRDCLFAYGQPMAPLILSADCTAPRQTHSRSSPHLHGHGSFSHWHQWKLHQIPENCLFKPTSNIHPPAPFILGTTWMTVFTSDLPPSSLWLPVAPVLCFPLWSLHLKTTLDACPCIVPHTGEQQMVVLARHRLSCVPKICTQFLLEMQNLCLSSPDCFFRKRQTGRLTGNCRDLHITTWVSQRGRSVTAAGRPGIKQDSLCT